MFYSDSGSGFRSENDSTHIPLMESEMFPTGKKDSTSLLSEASLDSIILRAASIALLSCPEAKEIYIFILKKAVPDTYKNLQAILERNEDEIIFDFCAGGHMNSKGEPVIDTVPSIGCMKIMEMLAADNAESFPLESNGLGYGYLVISLKSKDSGIALEQRILKLMTGSLGIIVRHAGRLDEERRMQTLLRALWNSAYGNDSGVDELLTRLLDGLRTITGSRYVKYVQLGDNGRDIVSFTTCSAASEGCRKINDENLQIQKNGVIEYVVNTGKVLISNDIDSEVSWEMELPEKHMKLERLLAIPAVIRDGLVSAVIIASGRESDYTNDDVERALTFVGGVRTILENIKIKEERDHIRTMLNRAQKLEAIGTLAGGIAHDFNNLLVAIRGFTELTMMDLDESDYKYANLEQIKDAADRASSLTRQLLLFSNRQPSEKEPVDLNEIIENLHKMLVRIIGEDIDVEMDLESNPWIIQADPGNLEQLIMNLAVNSKEAMKEDGGRIVFSTRNVTITEDDTLNIPYARPGDFIRLTISDDGLGMSSDVIDRIFEPFFTTKPEGKSTGLGLSVVYGIVNQHDGWITVDSQKNEGTVFSIYFPVFSHDKIENATYGIAIENYRGNGERILLVEDEQGVQALAVKALTRNGYVLYNASSAENALDIFERENGMFDLVFSDMVLPGMNGVDLVTILSERKPELKILLTSGYPTRKIIWSDIHKRGFRFLRKPYTITDLLISVRKALGVANGKHENNDLKE